MRVRVGVRARTRVGEVEVRDEDVGEALAQRAEELVLADVDGRAALEVRPRLRTVLQRDLQPHAVHRAQQCT